MTDPTPTPKPKTPIEAFAPTAKKAITALVGLLSAKSETVRLHAASQLLNQEQVIYFRENPGMYGPMTTPPPPTDAEEE